MTDKTLDDHLANWEDAGELEWKMELARNKSVFRRENSSRIVDVLTDRDKPSDLKSRIIDTMFNYWVYYEGRSVEDPRDGRYNGFFPFSDEDRSRLLRYFLRSRGKEKDVCWHKLMNETHLDRIFRIAKNQDEDIAFRIKAVEAVGEYNPVYGHRGTYKYLARLTSKLFGRFYEPNKALRDTAKRAFSNFWYNWGRFKDFAKAAAAVASGVIFYTAISSPVWYPYRHEIDDTIFHRDRPSVSIERERAPPKVTYLTADFESRVNGARLSRLRIYSAGNELLDRQLDGDKVHLYMDLKHRTETHSFHKCTIEVTDELGNTAVRYFRTNKLYIYPTDTILREDYVHVLPKTKQ